MDKITKRELWLKIFDHQMNTVNTMLSPSLTDLVDNTNRIFADAIESELDAKLEHVNELINDEQKMIAETNNPDSWLRLFEEVIKDHGKTSLIMIKQQLELSKKIFN